MIRGLGTATGLVVILAITLAVFGLPVGHSLMVLVQGAFGDKIAISRTLVKTIPLTIAGMGIVVAWKAGLYNIGGEGQFVMGGLAGCVAAIPLSKAHMPGLLASGMVLLASIAGGAIWGGIAGWLKVKRSVEVVISTILLNFIAFQVLAWAVAGPLRDPSGGVPLTVPLSDGFMLPRFDRQTDLHAGIIVALVAVLGVWTFLFLSKVGFQVRLVGEGERAARANRIPVDQVKILAMLISGGLCGLAGGVEYAGISGQLGTSFAQGWGFLAIPVALLGGLNPIWVALAALYFGALFAGSRSLAGFTAQGTTLIYIIQAVAVLGLIGSRGLAPTRKGASEAA